LYSAFYQTETGKNILDHSHAMLAEMFIMRRDKQTVGDGYEFIPFSPTELL